MSEVILLVVLIFLSGFFSGVETATMSLSRVKVRSLLEQKKAGAETLYKIKQNPNRLLITILIGNNLVNIAAASVATAASIRLFGDTGVGIATGVITLLVLFFGEITPKSFAIQNAESIALILARPIQILEIILWPAVAVFEMVTRFINKLTGDRSVGITEEELRSIIKISAEEGLLDKEAMERLHSVLDFETTTVGKIMTPRAQVLTFDANLTVNQFLESVLDAPFDRYPLYDKDPDNIVGILDVIDVVRVVKDGNTGKKLREIMRETFFVRKNVHLDALLPQFKTKETSLGIVVDENEKMVGVFTSQDIVEEIVGDIFENEVYKSSSVTNG